MTANVLKRFEMFGFGAKPDKYNIFIDHHLTVVLWL